MRASELWTTTEAAREGAADLLVRAGYTHRLADGLYSLLPLGQRVLQRINAIIRQQLARVGAQEVTLPLLQPASLWNRPDEAGGTRAQAFGSQLMQVVASAGEPLVLAPTHEEVAALLAAACVASERDLPRLVYQIQPRFRNQACPAEHGLLHTREFVMADAYGFHADRASLDATYLALRAAFTAVLADCGASARIVAADAGAIGGDESEEFVAPLPGMTATAALICDACGYAASSEIAELARPQPAVAEVAPCDEVPAALAPVDNRLVWVPFVAGKRIVLGVLPGGRLLSPAKLARALSRAGVECSGLHPAPAHELNALGATYDSISLVRTPTSVVVVADAELRSGSNFCIPSPRPGHLLINVNVPRDFRVDLFADIGCAEPGAACSRCGHALQAIRGVEVAHIFKLGSRYTDAFGARAGARSLQMSCYGLGATRLMATVAEQRCDARGLVWPRSIAPFLATIVPADPGALPAAVALYTELRAAGDEVLLDDTSAPYADKLAHADLRGIPFQLIVSADHGAGEVIELRERAASQAQRVRRADVAARLHDSRLA